MGAASTIEFQLPSDMLKEAANSGKKKTLGGGNTRLVAKAAARMKPYITDYNPSSDRRRIERALWHPPTAGCLTLWMLLKVTG
ncbi:hypothetical protein Ddc_06305 [Ditylenchus destructor]|nr:hypothetical protein Ddc_06305 [Ditylenchus destructor]